MKNFHFKDSRGDEYVFILYKSKDVRVTKRSKSSAGFRQIDFSADAIEKLRELLHQEET